jgi:hypothetical protein
MELEVKSRKKIENKMAKIKSHTHKQPMGQRTKS